MKKQTGLTRIDAVVALACIALVLAQAGIINAGGRERSKREVCLANLRMLTAAWKMYADDNAGKLVNGGQSVSNVNYGDPVKEAWWCTPLPPVPATDEVGTFPTTRFDWDSTLPYAERVSLLKRGALYKYCQDVNVFRCPDDKTTEHRSYIMPNSMNARWDGCPSNYGQGMVLTSTGQITKPSQKIVFLEERRLSPDALIIPYASSRWLASDFPDCTHDNGINLGYADGHSEFYKWQCQAMIDNCKIDPSLATAPDTTSCKKDIVKIELGVWGNLGWTPAPGDMP